MLSTAGKISGAPAGDALEMREAAFVANTRPSAVDFDLGLEKITPPAINFLDVATGVSIIGAMAQLFKRAMDPTDGLARAKAPSSDSYF